MSKPWILTSEGLPDEFEVVETKLDTRAGVRNCQRLKRQGNLWFIPSGEMYVYHTPTHWRTESPTTTTQEK